MARAQAQFLKIYGLGDVVQERWQSFYVGQDVTWDSQTWEYIPFAADGFTEGLSGDESDFSISAPAENRVITAFLRAIKLGVLAELSIYQFDSLISTAQPQVGQELIGRYTGQIVGANGGLTAITLQLGNALSPVGAQIPPRKFTTAIMGKGAIL